MTAPNAASVPKISKFDKRVGVMGKGISGRVELYLAKGGIKYAVKVYHIREKYETKKEYRYRVLHEYRILLNLHHCNIIPVYKYDVLLLDSTVKLYMMAGTPHLLKVLGSVKLVDLEIICYWKQLCLGVLYLHSQGISHRDLKLENIVFDEEYKLLKIIDFATADETPGLSVGLVGSEKYAAPETYSQIKYDGKVLDIWSMGIILYYMLHSKFPWKQANRNDLDYTGYTNATTSHNLLHFNEGSEITSQILEPNVEKRVTIFQLWEDAWFQTLQFCSESDTCGITHTTRPQIDSVEC